MVQKKPLDPLRQWLRQLIWDVSQRDFSLTRPHPTIANPEHRRRARLFLSILIGYVVFAVPIVLARILFDANYQTNRDPVGLGILIAAVGYGLGRSQHYNKGTFFTLIAFAGLTVGRYAQRPDVDDILYAALLLSINGMLASMLLSTFRTGFFLGLNGLGMGMLAISSPARLIELGPALMLFILLNGFVLAKKLLSQRDLQQIIDQSFDLVMSQRRFELVVDNLHEGLLITDLDDNVLYANTYMTALTGYTRNEFMGRKSLDLLVRDEDREMMLARNRQRARGKAEHYELLQRRRDGSTFLADVSGIPYFDLDGHVIGTIGVIADITEQRELERQKIEMSIEQEKTQLLRDLIGALSHDLKTPLSVINTNLYLLEHQPEATIREERLNILKKQTERLERLIESILTSYRLDSTHRPAFTSVDINALVRACHERFAALASSKHIDLQARYDTSNPTILGDEFSLDRAIDNLLENACNYTPENGAVTIKTIANGHVVQIVVSDTGIGIDESDMPRIFDRFFRADAARNSMRGGTGLGLSIVKQIVEIHQGAVAVESVVGAGTTFEVQLPLAETLDAAKSEHERIPDVKK